MTYKINDLLWINNDKNWTDSISYIMKWGRSGYCCWYSDWLRAGQIMDQIPVTALFFVPIQTDPKVHQPPVKGILGLSQA
jgi:hypothetical protein